MKARSNNQAKRRLLKTIYLIGISFIVAIVELYGVSNMFSGGLYVNKSKNKDRRQ
ncbi:MAG: hypothetical protein GX947_08490 [Tissierellia bacterium]|nr:hypothetical protein [Tissierellia bacterium]